MIVQIVRFRSGLSTDEVVATYEERAPQYRLVPGLRQKYYLTYPDTGEHGAVYIWDSRAAMDDFRSTDLARTLRAAYRVEGDPQVQLADVDLVLHPPAPPSADDGTGATIGISAS